MENKNKWIKKRHKIVTAIGRFILKPFLLLRYNLKFERFYYADERPYFIMYNHQTPMDQFMLSLPFKNPIYYIATEDIFSIGILSKVMEWGAAPIPIKKSGNDIKAVKTCIKVAREGGNIALAPEGNRTYSGETCYIKPSVVKLVRALKLPIVFVLFEGGYAKEPRWSNKRRKGSMKMVIKSSYDYDKIADFSDDELYELIKRELYNDDSYYPEKSISKHAAENLERLIYVCPECGLSEFESKGDVLKCRHCGLEVTMDENRDLIHEGELFRLRKVIDWYNYQLDYINKMDMSDLINFVNYTDSADIYEVRPYVKKELIRKNSSVKLGGNEVTIECLEDDKEINFEKINAMACCGRNKLNIYTDNKTYQLKGSKSFNPVKYMNIYRRYCNINKINGGNPDSDFLGM